MKSIKKTAVGIVILMLLLCAGCGNKGIVVEDGIVISEQMSEAIEHGKAEIENDIYSYGEEVGTIESDLNTAYYVSGNGSNRETGLLLIYDVIYGVYYTDEQEMFSDYYIVEVGGIEDGSTSDMWEYSAGIINTEEQLSEELQDIEDMGYTLTELNKDDYLAGRSQKLSINSNITKDTVKEPYVEIIKKDDAATNKGDGKTKWELNWIAYESEDNDREEFIKNFSNNGYHWETTKLKNVEKMSGEELDAFLYSASGEELLFRLRKVEEKGLLEMDQVTDVCIVSTLTNCTTKEGNKEEYDFDYYVCKVKDKWVIAGFANDY